MPLKRENVTKINAVVTNAEGNATTHEYLSEKQFEELGKEFPADKGFTIEQTRVQTFSVIENADSLDDLAQAYPKRAIEFAVYGARLAEQNVMRDFMKDADWAGVEGVYDLLPDVQDPKERKKASPRDKAINMLLKVAKESGKELDRAAVEAMLAQFLPAEEPAGATA